MNRAIYRIVSAAVLVLIIAVSPCLNAPAAQLGNFNQLQLPPAATVFTLTGLNFNLTNYMPAVFRGRFSRPPYRLIQVRYPASISRNTITKGVAALDEALRHTGGPIIVLAHSQGAQVASHWMREHATDRSAPPPSRLIFLLLGNPLRSSGGRGIGHREFGGTVGAPTPTNTPWRIIDVARRYDGWADPPLSENNQLASKNARLGRMTYHTHYDDVDLDDPTSTIWNFGNTTYVLTRETLPMWRNVHNVPDYALTAAAAYVESAYDRPPNDPKVIPLPFPPGDRLWRMKLQRMGVPLGQLGQR